MVTLTDIQKKLELIREKLNCYVSVSIEIDCFISGDNEIRYSFYRDGIGHRYYNNIQELMFNLDQILFDEPDEGIVIKEEEDE